MTTQALAAPQQRRRELVDSISAQVDDVQVGLWLANAFALLLISIGRFCGHFVRAWVWTFVAVRAGYREVRPTREQRAAARAAAGSAG